MVSQENMSKEVRDPEIGSRKDETYTGTESDYAADWDKDLFNPWNWPTWKKAVLVASLSSMSFLA